MYLHWRGITFLILGAKSHSLKEGGIDLFLNAMIFGIDFINVDVAHFWFIPTFVGIQLIYPFIYEIYNKNKNLINIFMIILFLESFVCTDIGNILNSFSIFKGVILCIIQNLFHLKL